MLAIGGAAIALLPGAPAFQLDPQLALALFVAPVLLDAAYDTSLRDLRKNWRPVANLVLIAVGLTTAAVAIVARLLVPEMSWGVAIALGAIVAPPDAAAASAVLRQLRLPHRLVVILEGESMLNDASALLVYRLAVSATMVSALTATQVSTTLLVVLPGSIVAGWVLARIVVIYLRPLEDIPSSIVMQFVTTFGVWLLAERNCRNFRSPCPPTWQRHPAPALSGAAICRWRPTQAFVRGRIRRPDGRPQRWCHRGRFRQLRRHPRHLGRATPLELRAPSRGTI